MEFLNNHLLEHIKLRKELLKVDTSKIIAWYSPCKVKVLLVTDGGLDFGMGDFGLSAFINCLQNEDRFYMKFDITLAHLRSDILVTDDRMGASIPNITNRITDFRFDDVTKFDPSKFDQVWLFGIETFFHQSVYSSRNNNRVQYPSDRLSNAELNIIKTFMDSGKGIFATGDHGALGNGLCGSIQRVKSMRIWNAPANDDVNTVSMSGSNRNDTNQVGDAGTQFSDQSDDIPQHIQPKLYHNRVGRMIDELYPHPLLCSKFGRINVMPDHPHEGECRVPNTANELAEYPSVGGIQILPEVIATSKVIAGNIATNLNFNPPSKHPTVSQTFGGICAYDGHRAGVGRIVTDATWHHFINVNLIGLVEGAIFDDLTPANDVSKHLGFLASDAGKVHMAMIKEYFINIGVWIATPQLIKCFNTKFWHKLLYSDRVMESALFDPNVKFDRIPTNIFYSIGTHAKDVLGRSASQCQSIKFILDILEPIIPSLIPRLDPWYPHPPFPEPEPPLPWFDPSPITNIMIGVSLVALRQRFPYADASELRKSVKEFDAILNESLKLGLEMGLKHYTSEVENYTKLLSVSSSELKKKY